MSDWKLYLRRLFDSTPDVDRSRDDVVRYIQTTVVDALQEVQEELKDYGRRGRLDTSDDAAALTVFHEGTEEFHYAVEARTYRLPNFAFPAMNLDDDEARYHRAEVHLRGEANPYDLMGCTREEVIHDFLEEYGRQMRWEKPSRSET